jgi:quinoprotein relay system zinc metallohydrolase 2
MTRIGFWIAALVLVLTGQRAGADAGAGAAVLPLPLLEVAAGVFVATGLQEETSPANLGRIANIGFIVGTKCVAVVDTGGSIVVGRRLRAAIARVTALPPCYVINTHAHPDHVFGNAAFAPEQPTYVGHAKLPAALAARGRNYSHALQRDLGAAVQGSEIIAPSLTVAETLELDLGGRTLLLRAWPVAHTDSDLTVEDRATGTLWLSDLLFVERIPVVDGSLKGWLEVIAALRKLQPRIVVAGHGEAGAQWRGALDRQERYLRTLLDQTRSAIKAKRTLQQAVNEVALNASASWLLAEGFHRRNVTAAFAELEWED